MAHRGTARPLVMGILNVTPDSFSDGGRFLRHGDAIAHGLAMAAEGADVVDVGGESSRPGAAPVPADEELARILPVIDALSKSVRVSVDTVKPAVARAAVEAGATLVNDISGTLWPVAAELSVGWVAMHMRGTPATMQSLTDYDDVATEVRSHVLGLARRAVAGGVAEVWVDPGIGFAKTSAQNLTLLAALPRLVADAAVLGARVLVGTSRKAFLGHYGRRRDGAPAPVEDRLEASIATAVWCMAAGAAMVRAHDVAPAVIGAALVGATPDRDGAGDGPTAVPARGASRRVAA